MQPVRVRLVESLTVALLEQNVNAALAALETDPAVTAIETVTYRPGLLGNGAVLTAMIVYRLASPVVQEAAAVAAAEAILADDPRSEPEVAP